MTHCITSFSYLLSLAQVIMALLATGAATAASMAELGKKGNLHARWNPICDRFGSFCSRGGIAIVSSFIGVALMLALNLLSAAANAHRPNVAGQWVVHISDSSSTTMHCFCIWISLWRSRKHNCELIWYTCGGAGSQLGVLPNLVSNCSMVLGLKWVCQKLHKQK